MVGDAIVIPLHGDVIPERRAESSRSYLYGRGACPRVRGTVRFLDEAPCVSALCAAFGFPVTSQRLSRSRR